MSSRAPFDDASGPFSAEELLHHGEALRALALELLHDRAEAEDLVQHAYLRALEEPPRSRRALGSWLRRVVRHRAIDGVRALHRRRAREFAVARPEAALPEPSTEERLEAREQVLAAVRALEEPYRTAVVLRFLEGLSVTEVAEREGCPKKTIETRLARALNQLRRRLDARHGGRRAAWAIALLPVGEFASRAAAASATAALGSNTLYLGMGAAMTKKIAWAALAAVVLLAVVWKVAFDGSSPASDGRLSERLAVEAAGAEERAQESAIHRERESPRSDAQNAETVTDPVAPEAQRTSLTVHLQWSGGVDPAPDVAVLLEPADGRPVPDLRIVTDERGSARFEDLSPGRWKLGTERGGSDELEVAAGEARTITWSLAENLRVRGVVRHARGAPAPGAEIWLANRRRGWLGGRIVARSGAEGRFELRAIPGTDSLGALAAGASPSKLVDLEAIEVVDGTAQVELVLEEHGARVFGRVVTSGGEPLVGALVAAGRNGNSDAFQMDGRVVEAWNPVTVETDADGFYAIEGLRPGRVRVSVRALGRPRRVETRELPADGAEQVDFVLEEGARVRGTVTGSDGAPVAGARVLALETSFAEAWSAWVGPAEAIGAFGRPEATTDAEGRFVLDGLPSGPNELVAYAGGPSSTAKDYGGRCTASLVLAPGEEAAWDPLLDRGLELFGRILEADGTPPSFGSILRLVPESGGHEDVHASWDFDGKFRICHLADVSYTAVFQLPGRESARFEGLHPGGEEEVVLTLPAIPPVHYGTVQGTLDAEYAARLANGNFQASLQREGSNTFQMARPSANRFRFEEVEPGRVRVVLMVGMSAFFASEWFELAPGEDRDLGILVPPPGGAVRIEVEYVDGAQPTAIRCNFGAGMFGRELLWDGNAFVAEDFPPGEHSIWIRAPGIYAETHGLFVPVTSGGSSTCRVRLRPGGTVDYVLSPSPGGSWEVLESRITEGERLLSEQHFRNGVGLVVPIRSRLQLPVGRFTMEVVEDGGEKVTRSFEVRPGVWTAEPLEFRFKGK